jgi:hypothetical protein
MIDITRDTLVFARQTCKYGQRRLHPGGVSLQARYGILTSENGKSLQVTLQRVIDAPRDMAQVAPVVILDDFSVLSAEAWEHWEKHIWAESVLTVSEALRPY